MFPPLWAGLMTRPQRRNQPPVTPRTFLPISVAVTSCSVDRSMGFFRSFSKPDHCAQPPFLGQSRCQPLFALSVSEILNKAPWGEEAGAPTARHLEKWQPVVSTQEIRQFLGLTPTARQIENWQPVVYFPWNNAGFGLDPELWRAVRAPGTDGPPPFRWSDAGASDITA